MSLMPIESTTNVSSLSVTTAEPAASEVSVLVGRVEDRLLEYVTGIAVDAEDNLWIADSSLEAVRRIDLCTGSISTACGIPSSEQVDGKDNAPTIWYDKPVHEVEVVPFAVTIGTCSCLSAECSGSQLYFSSADEGFVRCINCTGDRVTTMLIDFSTYPNSNVDDNQDQQLHNQQYRQKQEENKECMEHCNVGASIHMDMWGLLWVVCDDRKEILAVDPVCRAASSSADREHQSNITNNSHKMDIINLVSDPQLEAPTALTVDLWGNCFVARAATWFGKRQSSYLYCFRPSPKGAKDIDPNYNSTKNIESAANFGIFGHYSYQRTTIPGLSDPTLNILGLATDVVGNLFVLDFDTVWRVDAVSQKVRQVVTRDQLITERGHRRLVRDAVGALTVDRLGNLIIGNWHQCVISIASNCGAVGWAQLQSSVREALNQDFSGVAAAVAAFKMPLPLVDLILTYIVTVPFKDR